MNFRDHPILVGCVMLWIIFAVLCSVAEQQLVGSDGFSTLERLLHPSAFSITQAYNVVDYVNDFGNFIILWFNGTVWQGDWVWFWWIICMPISIGFIIELVLFFIWIVQALTSGAANIIGLFR